MNLINMKSHQLINQTSGKTEYFTPLPIVEAARLTMGSIDLDPASSARSNERVRATHTFDIEMDGLEQEWFGNIWLNWPFTRTGNPLWSNKLLMEFRSGRVYQVCCITYACTSETWFRPLMDFPQCFLYPRTNYVLPDGSTLRGVTKGSVVTYLGRNHLQFIKSYESLGSFKFPLRMLDFTKRM